jgi:AcrR family transcriptional regulator
MCASSAAAPLTDGRPARQDVDGLVDAAVRVFVERGYDGSSMEDIAREAGLAKSSIYHHVSGKEELLERAVDRAIAEAETLAAEVEATTDDPFEQLRLVARRVVEQGTEESPSQALLRRLPWMSASVPWAMERYLRHEQSVSAFVRRAIDAGAIRRDVDPLLMNRLLWLMTCAVADVRRLDPDTDVEQLIDLGLDVIWNGAATRDPARGAGGAA